MPTRLKKSDKRLKKGFEAELELTALELIFRHTDKLFYLGSLLALLQLFSKKSLKKKFMTAGALTVASFLGASKLSETARKRASEKFGVLFDESMGATLTGSKRK